MALQKRDISLKNTPAHTPLGYLFRNLTGFLLYESGWYASESELFLDLERMARPMVKHIDADGQFYRKLREDDLDIDVALRWMKNLLPGQSSENMLEDAMKYYELPKDDWVLLESFAVGVGKISCSEEVKKFWDYVCKLCRADEALLSCELDPVARHLEVSKWLLMKMDVATAPDIQAEYMVCRVLHWVAILELYLRLSDPAVSDYLDSGPRETAIDPFLPQLSRVGKLERSVALYLDNWRSKWRPQLASNAALFRKIAQASNKRSRLDEIDPPIETIKKAFNRRRSGELPLTIRWVEDNLGILGDVSTGKDFDCAIYLIPFINMFDFVQRELLKADISHARIVELFGRYSEHQRVVKDRFDYFKRTGAVDHLRHKM